MENKYLSSFTAHKQHNIQDQDNQWIDEVPPHEEPENKKSIDIIDKENEKIFKRISSLMPEGPESPAVQKLIKRHYKGLKNLYEPNINLYRGLANLYVEDGRFIDYFRKYHPDLPQFMHDAMLVFCVTND